MRLGRIGFDNVAGYLDGGMRPLEDAPELVERIERVTAGSLAEQLASTTPPLVVDVRRPGRMARTPDRRAVNLPLSQFLAGLATIERGTTRGRLLRQRISLGDRSQPPQREGTGRQRPRRRSRRVAGGEAAGHLHGRAPAPRRHTPAGARVAAPRGRFRCMTRAPARCANSNRESPARSESTPVGRPVYGRIHVGNARPLWSSAAQTISGARGLRGHVCRKCHGHQDEILDAAGARPGGRKRRTRPRRRRPSTSADTDALDLGRPDFEPRASDTIVQPIELIGKSDRGSGHA